MAASVELEELLSNEQTAALLGIKPNTLEIWRCRGKGPPFIKLGDHPSSPIRYLRSNVSRWIGERQHRSTSSYTVSNATPGVRRPWEA